MSARRYHVERHIDAPPEAVWAVLTDGARYTDWNDTVIRLDGDIAEGSTIELVSTANPKRAFKLKVHDLLPPHQMIWSDGMPLGLFKGVRTFRLDATDTGTAFSMTEEFSGPLAGLFTKMIPDLTESFNTFADCLATASQRSL